MKIEALPCLFSICKLKELPVIEASDKFTFLSVTDNELSLLCPTDKVPDYVTVREDSWRGYRIQGTLDFSLVGILADISKVLAENNIPIFVISTFETDYFFMKNKHCIKAMLALKNNGYEI